MKVAREKNMVQPTEDYIISLPSDKIQKEHYILLGKVFCKILKYLVCKIQNSISSQYFPCQYFTHCAYNVFVPISYCNNVLLTTLLPII